MATGDVPEQVDAMLYMMKYTLKYAIVKACVPRGSMGQEMHRVHTGRHICQHMWFRCSCSSMCSLTKITEMS